MNSTPHSRHYPYSHSPQFTFPPIHCPDPHIITPSRLPFPIPPLQSRYSCAQHSHTKNLSLPSRSATSAPQHSHTKNLSLPSTALTNPSHVGYLDLGAQRTAQYLSQKNLALLRRKAVEETLNALKQFLTWTVRYVFDGYAGGEVDALQQSLRLHLEGASLQPSFVREIMEGRGGSKEGFLGRELWLIIRICPG